MNVKKAVKKKQTSSKKPVKKLKNNLASVSRAKTSKKVAKVKKKTIKSKK